MVSALRHSVTPQKTTQMSHYFDLSTLEKNRQEAEEKKKKASRNSPCLHSVDSDMPCSQLKKYDWRKYKEIKKKERTKRRVCTFVALSDPLCPFLRATQVQALLKD